MVFNVAYEKISVAGSHFSTHGHAIDLFKIIPRERKTVECADYFLLHLRSTVDLFYHGEVLKHALVAIGKVDDHYHICPPIDSVSTECNGQRPLWKNHEILFNNLAKPFEMLKSRKMFQKIGSRRTNEKLAKFSERSATLRNFVGFQTFVKSLFAFLCFIGPFTKKVATLCSQLTL